jgi:hypothetical protein
MTYLFSPRAGGKTRTAATNSASTAAQFPTRPNGSFQIRVCNDGTTWGYIAWSSSSSVAATTSDEPLPPGQCVGFTVMNEGNNSPLYYSVIMASSTANITVSVGSGI